LSNRRKRDYWGKLVEWLGIAALSYVLVVSFTILLGGHSFHSWKIAIRHPLSHVAH
jgi:hypothetical protein